MPASSLIQCVPAVDLVSWIQSDWFIGQQGALLVLSTKFITGFKSQLADSCQFDSQMYGDNFIDQILKEYTEKLIARRYILKEKVISFKVIRLLIKLQFSNKFNLTFVFNHRNIYKQLSQLMFKLCSKQCRQYSGISLMLMLPCRPPRNSLSQKQSRMCRWDTYIKESWRRQKYRLRSH